jgi:hypothetical protein
MNKGVAVHAAYGVKGKNDAVGAASEPGYRRIEDCAPAVVKSRPHFASVSPTDRLAKVDALHVIPALGSDLPVRVFAASPLSQLPHALFRYLLTTVQSRRIPAGTLAVDPDTNRREYLAVLEGELEICRENVAYDGTEEIQIGRLMKSASTRAIILLHTIPRYTSVRAVTPARSRSGSKQCGDVLPGFSVGPPQAAFLFCEPVHGIRIGSPPQFPACRHTPARIGNSSVCSGMAMWRQTQDRRRRFSMMRKRSLVVRVLVSIGLMLALAACGGGGGGGGGSTAGSPPLRGQAIAVQLASGNRRQPLPIV